MELPNLPDFQGPEGLSEIAVPIPCYLQLKMKKKYLILVVLMTGCTGEQKTDDKSKPALQEAKIVTESEGNCEKYAASPIGAPEAADTVFYFSTGKKLILCGSVEKEHGEKIYSEFVLSECGKESIVSFWGAVDQYKVSFKTDTLQLRKLELLAVGHKRELKKVGWLTEYFYYHGKNLQKAEKLNSGLKYSQRQIEQTLQEYESTQWFTQLTSPSDAYREEKMALANRLMIAAVSGSQKAEEYFFDFKSKFKPAGAYAEWYDEMEHLLKFAKEQTNNCG
jgi:hypothetical protein